MAKFGHIIFGALYLLFAIAILYRISGWFVIIGSLISGQYGKALFYTSTVVNGIFIVLLVPLSIIVSGFRESLDD